MIKQKALETKQDPGSKVFEAGKHQFLGYSRLLHVELPTLMVCLAWLRAKSMRVGSSRIAERMYGPSGQASDCELREAPQMRAEAWSGATLDPLAGAAANDG